MNAIWDWTRDNFDALVSSAWTAAVAGRLVWHVRLAQKGVRGVFSWELLYEIPTVAFVYIVGTGIAEHVGWTGHTVGATVAVIAYFGPAGLQKLAEMYVTRKLESK